MVPIFGIAVALPILNVPFVEAKAIASLGDRLWPLTKSYTARVSAICRSMVRFTAKNLALSPPVDLRDSDLRPKNPALRIWFHSGGISGTIRVIAIAQVTGHLAALCVGKPVSDVCDDLL